MTHVSAVMVAICGRSARRCCCSPSCSGTGSRGPTAPASGCRSSSPGLRGSIGFPVFFTYGLQLTTASHAALILALSPVSTGLIAALLEHHRLSVRWIAGTAVALAGAVALVVFRLGLQGASESVVGDVLVLCALVWSTVGYVVGARASRTYGSWSITVWGILVSGVVVLPAFALLAPRMSWAAVASGEWIALGYLAVMVSIAAYVAWYWALAAGGIARVGLAEFTQPVVTVALALVMLREPPDRATCRSRRVHSRGHLSR